MINRRHFLAGLAALVGGVALKEAIPLGRVWSFPKEIVPLNIAPLLTIYYDKSALQRFTYVYRNLKDGFISPEIVVTGSEAEIMRSLIGDEHRFDHLDVVAVPADKIRPF